MGEAAIRGLSLATLLWNSLGATVPKRDAKTLIRQFFTATGPGMMWSRMREVIESQSAARVA